MTKMAEEFDKDLAIKQLGKGVDTWYQRVVRLQRNQEILVAALRMSKCMTEDEVRSYVSSHHGFGEEI